MADEQPRETPQDAIWDAYEPDVAEYSCPVCDGSGEVLDDSSGVATTCGACDGSGLRDDEGIPDDPDLYWDDVTMTWRTSDD